jgi:hypothetical protein
VRFRRVGWYPFTGGRGSQDPERPCLSSRLPAWGGQKRRSDRSGAMRLTGLTKKPITLRPCSSSVATVAAMRSMNRLPCADCVPCDILLQKSANQIACSASLFVFSIPSRCTTFQSPARSLQLTSPVRRVLSCSSEVPL